MKMTNKELLEWLKWYRQYNNSYHMSENDWKELVRLNHLVLDMTHEVHNVDMLKDRKCIYRMKLKIFYLIIRQYPI